MRQRSQRLSVIVVSANSARWLRPCLTTLLERAGEVDLDVVVVAAGCTDETVALVEKEFPRVRTIACENRGFAYANNQALRTLDAPDWVLLLNPDTELLDGTLAELIERANTRPSLGLVGVRQLTSDGEVFPTIRRFPSPVRSLFEALGSERLPVGASWLGERELDPSVYEHDVACDWTTGAFMLVRWTAFQSAGFLDERFFLYCEETDLCLRIKQAGWEVRHLPSLTILHHAEKETSNLRLHAQVAFAKRQYYAKHFSSAGRLAATGALALGYALRAGLGGRASERRRSSRASLTTLLGLRPPPFGAPPQLALNDPHGAGQTQGNDDHSAAAD